jgi:hypothetical protein
MSSSSKERVMLLVVELKPTGPPGGGAGPVLFTLGGMPIGLIAARSVRPCGIVTFTGGANNFDKFRVSDKANIFLLSA